MQWKRGILTAAPPRKSSSFISPVPHLLSFQNWVFPQGKDICVPSHNAYKIFSGASFFKGLSSTKCFENKLLTVSHWVLHRLRGGSELEQKWRQAGRAGGCWSGEGAGGSTRVPPQGRPSAPLPRGKWKAQLSPIRRWRKAQTLLEAQPWRCPRDHELWNLSVRFAHVLVNRRCCVPLRAHLSTAPECQERRPSLGDTGSAAADLCNKASITASHRIFSLGHIKVMFILHCSLVSVQEHPG